MGFRTGSMTGPAIETRYGKPVSYGIRRYEFDDFLLRRSGARLIQGYVDANTLRQNVADALR